MLFYPTRRNNAPSTRRGVSRPFPTSEAGDALHLTWMLKSLAMGVTLLGLSYWLVQIAGIQYLATLTSVTLLAFLLGYVLWCVLHRNRLDRQRSDAVSRMETGQSSIAGTTVPLTPTAPPPFDHHHAYKCVTRAPGRDMSPPPTYEEAIRAMMATTTCSPRLNYHQSLSPASGPQPSHQQSVNLASAVPAVSTPRLNTSTSHTSPSALISPPPSALTSSLSSPTALILDSAAVVQSGSDLVHTSHSVSTPQLATALTTPSTVLLTASQQPTSHAGDML